jgi:hypothetical protein
MSELVNEL